MIIPRGSPGVFSIVTRTPTKNQVTELSHNTELYISSLFFPSRVVPAETTLPPEVVAEVVAALLDGLSSVVILGGVYCLGRLLPDLKQVLPALLVLGEGGVGWAGNEVWISVVVSMVSLFAFISLLSFSRSRGKRSLLRHSGLQ